MDRILHQFGTQLTHDKELIMSVAKGYDKALAYAHEDIFRDVPFLMDIMNKNGACLAFAHETARDHDAIVLAAVKKKGKVLKYASERLKSKKEIVLAAVRKDGKALQFASESLRCDKEIVLAAAQAKCPVQYIPTIFLANDVDIILEVLTNKHTTYCLEIANENLRADKAIVSLAVKQNGLNLAFASPELQQDFEIVRLAAKQNFLALKFTSLSFQEITPLIFDYINSHNYWFRRFEPNNNLNTCKFRLIATVAKDVHAWRFAAEQYTSDKELMLVAIRLNAYSYHYVSAELLFDRDIVMTTMQYDHQRYILKQDIAKLCAHFQEDIELLTKLSHYTSLEISILKQYERWKNADNIKERWLLDLNTDYLKTCKTLFYPGAEYDFSNLQFFMENSGITDFYYTDYMNNYINHDTVWKALFEELNKDGYFIANKEVLSPAYFNEYDWAKFWYPNKHARFGSEIERSFISKFTIQKNGKSWHLYYFGTEAIATFELLLKRNIHMDVVVTQDHGLGGCWTTFCKGSLLEKISKEMGMMPQYLLSGNGEPWRGYHSATVAFGKFGMHKAPRTLYRLV